MKTIAVALMASFPLLASYVTNNNSVVSSTVTPPAAGIPWAMQAKLDVIPTGGTGISYPIGSTAVGFYLQIVGGSPSQMAVVMQNETGQTGFTSFPIGTAPSAGIYVTLLHDALAAGSGHSNTDTIIIWNVNTGTVFYTNTQTYATNTTNSNGTVTVGGQPSPNQINFAFMRICTGATTTAPATIMASKMPTTAGACPVGTRLIEWRADSAAAPNSTTTLGDLSGNGYTGTVNTGTITYTTTLYTGIISVIGSVPPLGAPAPTWSNWVSLKAGSSNQLNGSASLTECSTSNSVGYSWLSVSGPTSPSFTGATTAMPTVTNIVDTTVTSSDYVFQLTVSDTCSNPPAVSTLEMGAVTMDNNGIVIPQTANELAIFGPQIAFGQNPWGYADQLQQQMVTLQAAYQAQYPTVGVNGIVGQNDWTWNTEATGTISYPYAGKGFNPGPACTTLTFGIGSSSQTLQIADASCLSLSSLPTWILVGNMSYGVGTFEQIRICSTTALTGAATLTACYDGRGVSGNTNYNPPLSPVAAQAWPSGTLVGEMRVQGTSTLFVSDSQRAVCPAGAPGPTGLVSSALSNVGSITVSGNTVTGTGTAWPSGPNSSMIGDYIRIPATHNGGTPFIWWGMVTAVASATSLTVDHPAPTFPNSMDAGPWTTYNVTTPIYVSLEANAPTDGHIIRFIQNGIGCESETAMFTTPSHDVTGLDNTVQPTGASIHDSYAIYLSGFNNAGFYPEWYGGGCLSELNFFFRSGYTPALNTATPVCQNWIRNPQVSDGFSGGDILAYAGSVNAEEVYMTLFPSNGVLGWNNIEGFASQGSSLLTPSPFASCSAHDTRETYTLESWTAFAANWDTNAGMAAAYTTTLQGLLTRDQTCRRNASDGYTGDQINSYLNTFNWNPNPTPIALTNGSTAATGAGLPSGICGGVDQPTITVTHGSSLAQLASGTLSQQNVIYITDTTVSPPYVGVYQYGVAAGCSSFGSGPNCIQLAAVWPGGTGTFNVQSETATLPAVGYGWDYTSIWTYPAPDYPTVSASVALVNNQALAKVWSCVWNSATSLTLNRPWDGPSSPGGTPNYYVQQFAVGVSGQQPFMFGIQSEEKLIASKNSNPTVSALAASFFPQNGAWFDSYGYDSLNNHGTFYGSAYQACEPINGAAAAGNFLSIHGDGGLFLNCDIAGKAVGAAAQERVNSVEGGSAMLQYVTTGGSLATGATFYGAIFAYPPYCWASVSSTCADGQFASPNYMGGYKWPGFYFGLGGFFTTSFPAYYQCSQNGGSIVNGVCVAMTGTTLGVVGLHGDGGK